jgi:hypothetical protein
MLDDARDEQRPRLCPLDEGSRVHPAWCCGDGGKVAEMPITYDPDVVAAFFGSPGEINTVAVTEDRIVWIEYSGPLLKYRVLLHLDQEAVSVSGDPSHPFGADSAYEICVPCSHISEFPDGYHPGQKGLSFCFGGADFNKDRTMTIMKTPAGELKVWPEYAFPAGHGFSRDRDRAD